MTKVQFAKNKMAAINKKIIDSSLFTFVCFTQMLDTGLLPSQEAPQA